MCVEKSGVLENRKSSAFLKGNHNSFCCQDAFASEEKIFVGALLDYSEELPNPWI